MLKEILRDNINDLNYEEILENNENNIKLLKNNINIAFENKDQTIDFDGIESTNYKQFLTIINKKIEVDSRSIINFMETKKKIKIFLFLIKKIICLKVLK